nr:hypothetical protein [Tanacetum cinerariifolium]
SVAFYLDKTEKLAPGTYASQTNQLAFLTQQGLLPAAEKLSAQFKAQPDEPALRSNQQLLALLMPGRPAGAAPAPTAGPVVLDAAAFAELYHGALRAAQRAGQSPARSLKPWLGQVQQAAAQPENAPYYEQLLFLQAVLLHAAGQEVAARQALGPLLLGRAALYRFRDQRQNELNALRRALKRQPDEKIILRLASLYSGPTDFFEGLEVLRQGRRAFPRSAA